MFVPMCVYSEVEGVPEDSIGLGGQGLLEAQEIAKRVYRLASWNVQRSGQAIHSIVRADLTDADDEREVSKHRLWSSCSYCIDAVFRCHQSRLDRKRRHITLRCAFDFRVCLHLLTHLRFVNTDALTDSLDSKVCCVHPLHHIGRL